MRKKKYKDLNAVEKEEPKPTKKQVLNDLKFINKISRAFLEYSVTVRKT